MPTPAIISIARTDRDTLRARLERVCRPHGRLVYQPSGFAELDRHLPGGGWPVGALTECLLETQGFGELSLWLPALRHVVMQERHIALLAPPWLPYAPALAQQGIALQRLQVINTLSPIDLLWALEQTLRCSSFGAVLGWPPAMLTDKQLRRLQLAAEAGRNIGILYRPLQSARTPSPAALRIKLQPVAAGLQVTIHKSRGAQSGATVQLKPNRYAAA
jgi:hypothetical protein